MQHSKLRVHFKVNASVGALGFTLIEILVVMTLVALLAGLATPLVRDGIVRSKEAALKENLSVMRDTLDDYYADKAYYPSTMEMLVEDRYIRFVPVDPVTGSSDTWQFEMNSDNEVTGIEDVRSGSDELSRNGSRYSEW